MSVRSTSSCKMCIRDRAKLSEGKSEGYARGAKKYNLKEMSKTLIFLQEHKIGSTDELNERAAAATEKYHQLGDSIKAAETRMAEIAVLKTHIVNYAIRVSAALMESPSWWYFSVAAAVRSFSSSALPILCSCKKISVLDISFRLYFFAHRA